MSMPPPAAAPPPPPPGFGDSSTGPAVTHGKATASLVCGILGFFCLGIILGPVAIWLGNTAKREIRESGGRLKGDGMATAGIVLGVIAVVAFVIGVIIIATN